MDQLLCVYALTCVCVCVCPYFPICAREARLAMWVGGCVRARVRVVELVGSWFSCDRGAGALGTPSWLEPEVDLYLARPCPLCATWRLSIAV